MADVDPLVLVPGADWAYAIAAGLRDRSVLAAVAGLLAGYAGLTAVVAAGAAAVIARSPLVLTVLTTFGQFDDVRALALQPDLKIVAAGAYNNGTSTVVGLARYNADGSLDAGFGSGGQVTTDLGGLQVILP